MSQASPVETSPTNQSTSSGLAGKLRDYVRACFPGIWVITSEAEEAVHEIAQLGRDESWNVLMWDIDGGLRGESAADPEDGQASDTRDPLTALEVASQFGSGESASLVVLRNFHRFLASPEIVQRLERLLEAGKRQRMSLVILAPLVDLPDELEKLFVVVDHALPDRDALEAIARELATEPGELPAEPAQLEAVLAAAAGLTRLEAEGAMSLSLVRTGQLDSETIWRVKAQQLRKSGLVTLHEGEERLDQLGGLDALKAFCLRALAPRARATNVSAKGVLLLSPPGCGKSALGKGLGAELGLPTLRLDVGQLMGSLVGQTEANTRRAIAVAEAMAPCVLLIDEVDKALAGTGGSTGGSPSDSGVGARLLGTLLTWMADRTSQVFVVATANRIDHLPPELTRAERLDGVFFIDLPGREEKDAIWRLHRATFQDVTSGSEFAEPNPNDEDWTGAEIRSCCRLAALLDEPLSEAARRVVPVAKSSPEVVSKLRSWASGRCLSANGAGLFEAQSTSTRRRARPVDPSLN